VSWHWRGKETVGLILSGEGKKGNGSRCVRLKQGLVDLRLIVRKGVNTSTQGNGEWITNSNQERGEEKRGDRKDGERRRGFFVRRQKEEGGTGLHQKEEGGEVCPFSCGQEKKEKRDNPNCRKGADRHSNRNPLKKMCEIEEKRGRTRGERTDLYD